MSSDKPRVSIGLPVLNGEEYLEEALDSILAQTYSDFELVISDDASTDHTQRICRAYAAKDRRIRYYRNERTLGASKNFNRVFELSSGEYFKWAAHDDVLAPEFLRRCVSVLARDSSIVLCYSKIGRIDEYGALVGTYDYKMRLDSQKPHERFGNLLGLYFPLYAIFGVIRASALKMTPLIQNYIESDKNLLAEISLIGRIYEIPEYLFFRRAHPKAFSNMHYTRYQERWDWWTKAGQIRPIDRSTFIRCFPEYFKSVRRVPLKWSERQLCYAQISRWFIREGWTWMGSDLYAIYKFLLSRSNLGRKLASATDRVLRRTIILTIKKKKGVA